MSQARQGAAGLAAAQFLILVLRPVQLVVFQLCFSFSRPTGEAVRHERRKRMTGMTLLIRFSPARKSALDPHVGSRPRSHRPRVTGVGFSAPRRSGSANPCVPLRSRCERQRALTSFGPDHLVAASSRLGLCVTDVCSGIEPTLEKNGDHPVAQFHRTIAVTPPPPKYVSWGEQLTGRMDACLVVRRQDIVHLGQPSRIAGYTLRTIAMAALTARSLF
jgi:hypothetical protein